MVICFEQDIFILNIVRNIHEKMGNIPGITAYGICDP